MNLSDALSMITDRHTEARKLGLYFQNVPDQQIGSRRLVLDGGSRVWFGSCGYLGLEHDPRVIAGAVEAAQRYGTQFASSRGYFSAPLYEELEHKLDTLFGGHVLTMPLTTIAHQAALPVLATERDCIVLDHQCHATIQVAARYAQTRGTAVEVVRHDQLDRLSDRLPALARRYRSVWICVDGVYSMFGDLAPVSYLQSWLDTADNVMLYVDDAHGMSWDGLHGRGNFLARMPQTERIVVSTTFAKATGAGGAALIFPTKAMADRVKLSAGPVVFSGPLQPPMQGALLASVNIHLSPDIYQYQQALATRVDRFNTLAEERGLPLIVVNESPVFFIRMGKHQVAQEVARRVLDDGFAINVSMFPSVPQRRSGLRVAMTAIHEPADIEALVDSLARHVPAVLGEYGVSGEELDSLFEGAVPDSGAGRLIEQSVGASRLAQAMADEGVIPVQTRPDDLEIVRWDHIDQVPQEVWDARMGVQGCTSWESLKAVSAAMADDDDHAPEHRWRFRYIGIRQPNTGRWLAMTSFNEALQKDDIFMYQELSEELERLRRDDPYLLTSRFIGTGSFFSEGSHLWLDREGDWQPALRLLIEEGLDYWRTTEAAYLLFRDLDAADGEIGDIMRSMGLVAVPLPTTYTLHLSAGATVESWLSTLGRRSRNKVRQLIAFSEGYRVQLWGGADHPAMDEVTRAHCFQLYADLAARNRRINNFTMPDNIVQAMLDSPSWRVCTLHRIDGGPPDGEAVAWGAIHTHGDHDMPLLCGVDPAFSGGSDSAYRQLLIQIVRQAIDRGQRVVHLGMDASIEKKRLGAVGTRKVAWSLKRGDHHEAELAEVIARMSAQPMQKASK